MRYVRSGFALAAVLASMGFIACGDDGGAGDSSCDQDYARAACAAACACAADPEESCGFREAGTTDAMKSFGGGAGMTAEEFCVESLCRYMPETADYSVCRPDVDAGACEVGALVVDATCIPD